MSRELPHPMDPQTLLSLLKECPDGWKVHELLQEIQRRELCGDLKGDSSDIELFRLNFWLLHQLFLLRRDLINRGAGDLRLSSMDIALIPFESPGTLSSEEATSPEKVHPLESYYLDLNHYWETGQRDIDELLEGFWRKFMRWDKREEMLNRWGIDPTAPQDQVKSRIMDLVKELHPDKGGNPDEFRELWTLWESFRSR